MIYFALGRSLGKGDLGEVRVWVNKGTGTVRAVKIYKKEKLKGDERIRFLYEIEIMKKLDHPNILRLYEIFQDDKRYYLVTELCTGGELFEELSKRGRFSEAEAALIINQVLEAVSYCHANNIVHRDIKPENIMIEGKSQNIKIVEFGASQKFDSEHKMTSAYGTLHFIAPEVLMIDYDEKWDIWSVGVCLYILLSGKPPFDGDCDKDIAKKIKMGEYKMVDDEWMAISDEAKDLVK